MGALEVECKQTMGANNTTFIGAIIDNRLYPKHPSRYICTKIGRRILFILKARKVFAHEDLSTVYTLYSRT